MLCDVYFCVISCFTLLALSRTLLGWYHPKVFTASHFDFFKLGDAEGNAHNFLPLLVSYWIPPEHIPVGGSVCAYILL